MPAVAALLVVAGYEAIKVPEIEDVRDTGAGPRWTMVFTFVATLFLPIQYAVLLGVVISVLVYLYRSSTDLRLVELGEVSSGIVYATDAKASDRVATLATFPEATHDPIRYPAALAVHARPPARDFLAYLQSPEAAGVFEAAGFTVVPRR